MSPGGGNSLVQTSAPNLSQGGTYQFDLGLLRQPMTNGQNLNITGTNGEPLIAERENDHWRVYKTIDTGGGMLGAHHNSRYNDTPYDIYDLEGKFLQTNQFKGIEDADIGSFGALIPILMAGGAAAALGAGGGGGASAMAGMDAAYGGFTVPSLGGTMTVGGAAGTAAGSGLAGEVLSKAALDGTTSFGANSAAGALDTAALNAAAPGVASANAVTDIVNALNGVTPPVTNTAGGPPGGDYGPPPPEYNPAELPTEANVPPPPGAPPGTPPATPPAAPPTGAPPASPPGAAPPGTPPNSGPPAPGPIDQVRNAIADALKSVGLTPQQATALGGALASMYGGSDMPSAGNPGQSGQQQADAAKQFLEAVMPYVRTNSVNPTGSSTWSRGADGSYTLNSQLNPANQQIYDDATSKLSALTSGLNPNAQAPALLDSAGPAPTLQRAGAAPTLLDSVGGQYQSDLAQAIFDRTMSVQRNTIESQKRALEARLAEQGFFPGQEGYEIAMNQFQDNLLEAQNLAGKDAQIRAAEQALSEGKFTNDSRLAGYDASLRGLNLNNNASQQEFDDALAGATFTNNSRTQGFKNQQDLQAQLAQILAGTRANATAGMKDLVSSSSAPTGVPANTVAAAGQQYTADLANYVNDNAARNDLIRALMSWGLT